VGGGSLASAQLQLYIGSNPGNWGPTGRTVDLYRLDAGWVERAVTWNCADDAMPTNATPDCATQWNGGTMKDDATDSVVITDASSGWVHFDVTADVLAFLAGGADDGWLIRKAAAWLLGPGGLYNR
jgi:hypothetical protein